MKIERTLPVGGQSKAIKSCFMLTAWVPARRSTRFWSYVKHNQEDYEKQDQKTQASHPVPPPFQGVTDRIFRQHPASKWRQVYFIMG